MRILENLKPERVFYYFEELTKIPRCSYDEKRVSDYLKSVGESLGLETIQDESLNIIIRKPASKGYENSKGVIIQGHMDMVCEKEEQSNHDFKKDPIELRIDGDFIKANDTTLGADNGIAVAMGLAILEDTNLKHPELELLVTVAEEVEMDGAFALSKDILKGERFLNIDSEEEGTLVMGSAGGELVTVSLPLKIEKDQFKQYKIELGGLKGGHSGMEIDTPRKNSNKLLNELLLNLYEDIDFRLIDINGGNKDNAITRNTKANIALKDTDKFESIIEIKINELIEKYNDYEKEIEVIVEDKGATDRALDTSSTEEAMKIIKNIHTGVFSRIKGNENMVESSSNLAIVKTYEDKLVVETSTRSSSEESLKKIREDILNSLDGTNAETKVGNYYPEWEYKEESELREIALSVYKDIYKKEMKTDVIHAGLECGVINSKYPNMDMISFGPNMYDVHTPKEKLSISSSERIYEYTIKLLEALK